MSDTFSYMGAETPDVAQSEYSADRFPIDQAVGKINVATLVKIVKVTNTPGQVAAVGRVDVIPLVNQLDGRGKPMPHQKVHSLSYHRFAGGRNAILIDPEVGDVGLMVVSDKDTSSVRETGKASNPGSHRRFNLADGTFFAMPQGPYDNSDPENPQLTTPNQYMSFTNDGLTIQDKHGNKMVMSSTGIAFTCAKLTANNDIIAGQGGSDQVSLQNHKHGGVTSGSDQTDKPVAGT